MRILGVDPGTNILGYAIIDTHERQPTVVTIGVMKMSKFPEHAQKLRYIYQRLDDIIREFRPESMAIEAPFYGKNVQSMLKLGRAQGVAIAAAAMSDIPMREYAPRKIKQAITGNGNSSKEQVAWMLNQMLAFEIPQNSLDATDALAAAVCHHHVLKSPLGQKKANSWREFIANNPDRVE